MSTADPGPTRLSLLQRMQDPKDRAAWEEFETLYRPLIRVACERFRVDRTSIDDVTQEVLIAVFRNYLQFVRNSNRKPLRAWLWDVTRNKATDWVRKNRRQKTGVDGLGDDQTSRRAGRPGRQPGEGDMTEAEWNDLATAVVAERVLTLLQAEVPKAHFRAFEIICVERGRNPEGEPYLTVNLGYPQRARKSEKAGEEQDSKYAKAAAELGCATTTVRNRVSLVRKRFAELYAELTGMTHEGSDEPGGKPGTAGDDRPGV